MTGIPCPTDAAVEAELALAVLTGLKWRGGQTEWCGHIVAYTPTSAGPPMTSARTVLYDPDGTRLGVSTVSGVTERELEHKTLAWAIRKALAAQEGGAR